MAAAAAVADPNLSINTSVFSLTSQEQLEAALADLIKKSGPTRGWCHGEPITDRGKRRQVLRMLTLVLIPLVILLGVATYNLVDGAVGKLDTDKTKAVMTFSVRLGELVHTLQNERDQSALYLSIIGPETKTFLLRTYAETDAKLELLTDWPVELVLTQRREFSSKEAFKIYLVNHRNLLGILSRGVLDELQFYTDCLSIFMRWLYDALKETKYSSTWKSIVAYQKIVFCKEDAGIERALGSYFFSSGGFTDNETYDQMNRQINVLRHNYWVAQNYSPLVKPISHYDIIINEKNLSDVIKAFRLQIQLRNISKPSVSQATQWFDNMTLYMNLLLEVQNELSTSIFIQLEDQASAAMTKIILTGFTIVVAIGLCPVLIKSIVKLTTDIQSFAITLADKTKELNREKKRTDSLLYQMLPKSVAEQLKKDKGVCAEYFKEVTIFFSDIHNFSQVAVQVTPMQMVQMLNTIFVQFDERIEFYNVYKVETIGSSYMVASGLPIRNGTKHATEIANMALDLQTLCSNMVLEQIPNSCVQLRIGIHSGPAVAGVVGNKRPRYCIFGDTVNTASRMQTNGQASRIHISDCTYRILSKHGGYRMQKRGPLSVKGKGQMTTYWLYRAHHPCVRGDADLGISRDFGQTSSSVDPFISSPEYDDDIELTFTRPRKKSTKILSNRNIKMSSGNSTDNKGSISGTSYRSIWEAKNSVLPTYEDLEREFMKDGSPPIVQLTEGLHY